MISYFLLLLFFVFDPDCQSFFFFRNHFALILHFLLLLLLFLYNHASKDSLSPHMKRTRYETEDATGEQKRPSYNGRDNLGSVTVKDLVCQLPPTCSPTAPSRFSSIADFEQHYNQFHSFRCIECQRSFPSDRFLDLHIAENHDPFFKLRLERGEKVVSK